MKYCDNCRLKVNMDSQKCPLCSMVLSDIGAQKHEKNSCQISFSDDGMESVAENVAESTAEDLKYPKPENNKGERYNFVFRLLLFLSVVISSTSLLINLLTYSGVLWSLYVIGSILYAWITIAYPIFVRRKIGQIIVINTISTAVYLYLLELGTQIKGWGLSYVTPFLFIVSTLLITFIILLRRLKWREYTIYQTIMVILGFLPVIFWAAGLVKPVWPSILSAFYSFLTLTGMFIFVDKKYKDELIKRFHL